MKKNVTFISVSIFISCVFAFAILLFVFGIRSDIKNAPNNAKAQFDLLVKKTSSAAAKFEPGTKEFSEAFVKSIADAANYKTIELIYNGDTIYSYPPFQEELVPGTGANMYENSVETADGGTLVIKASLFAFDYSTVFYRSRLSFLLILAGTIVMIFFIIITSISIPQNKNPEEREKIAELKKIKKYDDVKKSKKIKKTEGEQPEKVSEQSEKIEEVEELEELDDADEPEEIDEINEVEDENVPSKSDEMSSQKNFEDFSFEREPSNLIESEKEEKNETENDDSFVEFEKNFSKNKDSIESIDAIGATFPDSAISHDEDLPKTAEDQENDKTLFDENQNDEGTKDASEESINQIASPDENQLDNKIEQTSETANEDTEPFFDFLTQQFQDEENKSQEKENDSFEVLLERELTVSANENSDISLMIIRIKDWGKSFPPRDTIISVIKEASESEFVYDFKNDEFAVILQNTNLDDALDKAQIVLDKLNIVMQENGAQNKITIGITAKTQRMISGNRFITEADEAEKHAEKESDSPIIAFRVNPEKYNDFILNNLN